LRGDIRMVDTDKITMKGKLWTRGCSLMLFLLCTCCAARRASIFPPGANPDGSTPWVDLRPGMELRIEQAYFREGSPKRDLADYLGAQSVAYGVGKDGALRAGEVTSFLSNHPEREQPRDQPPVQTLIPRRNLRYRYHRLFFQLAMSRTEAMHPAVLIGSGSVAQLDKLTKTFVLAGSRCGPRPSDKCVTFPAFSTTSLVVEVVVNGVSRKLIWGSTLGSVATNPRSVKLLRNANGRLESVPVDIADPETLRIILLHGDQLDWN